VMSEDAKSVCTAPVGPDCVSAIKAGVASLVARARHAVTHGLSAFLSAVTATTYYRAGIMTTLVPMTTMLLSWPASPFVDGTVPTRLRVNALRVVVDGQYLCLDDLVISLRVVAVFLPLLYCVPSCVLFITVLLLLHSSTIARLIATTQTVVINGHGDILLESLPPRLFRYILRYKTTQVGYIARVKPMLARAILLTTIHPYFSIIFLLACVERDSSFLYLIPAHFV